MFILYDAFVEAYEQLAARVLLAVLLLVVLIVASWVCLQKWRRRTIYVAKRDE